MAWRLQLSSPEKERQGPGSSEPRSAKRPAQETHFASVSFVTDSSMHASENGFFKIIMT